MPALSAVRSSSLQHTLRASTPAPQVKVADQEAPKSSLALGDSVRIGAQAQKSRLQNIGTGALAGAGTGVVAGALFGKLLPTVNPANGIAIGAAAGAGAGVLAGASAGFVVDKFLDGKTSSTAAGAGLGAVAGAVTGVVMAKMMGGHSLMNAGFMAIPGAVAGAVSGFATAATK